MYISKILISNFRNFKNNVIEFNPGLNVIIGPNNAGKTNLIKALQLIFDRENRKKPTIDDFSKISNDFSKPPKIEITATISESKKNDMEMEDDKNVIYDWLVKETPKYEAQLTYIFYLPSKHMEDYRIRINELKDNEGNYKQEKCFRMIDKVFLKKYVSQIYGGDPKREEKATSENLDKFDFQFLDAIRDAEKEMFYGNNTLLRDVLTYFLDFEITEGRDLKKLGEKQKKELEHRENEFNEKSKKLLKHLIGRVAKDKILEYSEETGADKGGKPDFDAEVSEQEILFALRLIIEKNGIKIPIKNNGLGYNNLLFIALVLAKMQMKCSASMGDNAKIFPMLAIEEPEAHLHPSMQYKLLQFLNTNLSTKEQARQIFVTSHSTNITSAVDLNSIICLYEDIYGKQSIGYPGKVFSNRREDKESKNYVERFLDATKSNMLFADRIIFVEGLAEKLLLPCFAAYLDKEEELLTKHVDIVSVDSCTFKHFLKIFSYNTDLNPYAINKKVACLTDADPMMKEKESNGENKKYWEKCYPFELNQNQDYEYKEQSFISQELKESLNEFKNIEIDTPPVGTGKTLEYELAINNPSCELLITDILPSRGKNKKEFFKEIMRAYDNGKCFRDLESLSNHDKIKKLIDNCNWRDSEEKKKALIAAIYYQAVENIKGGHAFSLEKQLRENLSKKDKRKKFIIPQYIKNSINYVTS